MSDLGCDRDWARPAQPASLKASTLRQGKARHGSTATIDETRQHSAHLMMTEKPFDLKHICRHGQHWFPISNHAWICKL